MKPRLFLGGVVAVLLASAPLAVVHADNKPSVQALARSRADAAAKAYAALDANFKAGTGHAQLADLVTWSARWKNAERDAAATPADAQAAADRHLERLKVLSSFMDVRYQKGLASTEEKLEMDYFLAEAAYEQAKGTP